MSKAWFAFSFFITPNVLMTYIVLIYISIEYNNSYTEYVTQFTNLTITSSQLVEEKHKLDAYYSYKCVTPLVTHSNTRIGMLLSTAHEKGILSSLINILVLIHNSFVIEYTQLFPESNKYATDNTVDIFSVFMFTLLSDVGE